MYREWKDRTTLAMNEIGLYAIENSVEEEVLDVGVAQTEDGGVEEEVLDVGIAHAEDDACPTVAVLRSEWCVVSRINIFLQKCVFLSRLHIHTQTVLTLVR